MSKLSDAVTAVQNAGRVLRAVQPPELDERVAVALFVTLVKEFLEFDYEDDL